MKNNNFIHRIDKEAIAQMPLAEFGGEIYIINSEKQLPLAMQYLNQQTVVGVDTETRPSFQHGQHFPTALVQIATLQRCYLFQLKHIGLPQELADFFANPEICKVGLAFQDDIRGLQRQHNFKPQNCIDLQKIVLQYGILDLGLQKMFAIVFGKRISKSQQLTNWANDTLTDEQASYASTDAWATLCIYNELMKTKKLPGEQYEAIRQEDIKRQIQHQQQVQQEKLDHENHSTTNS